MRTEFILVVSFLSAGIATLAYFWPPAWHAFWVLGPVILLGLQNIFQSKHTLLRNYPALGYGRYLMETIRPGVQQYFIESNTSGAPLSREFRSIVYQRAKGVMDTVPFGTLHDVYGRSIAAPRLATLPTTRAKVASALTTCKAAT